MKSRKKSGNVNKNERGAALFTAIFGLLLLTLLATSLYMISDGEKRVAINYGENLEAFYVAEAGLSHAVGLYVTNGKDYSIATDIPTAGVNFGAGKYVVQTVNGTQPNTKVITATGTGKNGATATIEATIQFATTSVSDAAIVVNGNVNVSANIQILGTMGVIHANGNMTLSGNNRAQKYFSATGTITGNFLSPCPNGSKTGIGPGCDLLTDVRFNQETQTVPDIKPSDFFADADYRFYPEQNGVKSRITDKLGNVVATNCHSGCWGGWTWNKNQGWVANSSANIPAGTYYAVESSFQINRTFGSGGSPLNATFVADANVAFSGGTSYMDGKAQKNGRKFAAVAGADIAAGGANINTSSNQSSFYARHQFNLDGGQPRIYGNIMVYNEADTPLFGTQNIVQRQNGNAFMSSGDPQVIFNGNSTGGSASGAVTINQWREVRN